MPDSYATMSNDHAWGMISREGGRFDTRRLLSDKGEGYLLYVHANGIGGKGGPIAGVQPDGSVVVSLASDLKLSIPPRENTPEYLLYLAATLANAALESARWLDAREQRQREGGVDTRGESPIAREGVIAGGGSSWGSPEFQAKLTTWIDRRVTIIQSNGGRVTGFLSTVDSDAIEILLASGVERYIPLKTVREVVLGDKEERTGK